MFSVKILNSYLADSVVYKGISVKNPYIEDFSHNKRSLYCKYCACGPKFAGNGKGMGINMYVNGENSNKQLLIDDSVGRKILDAAITIINNEGYENLTIRKVAKESGCSNSAIYLRFEDKDALARAVAELHAKPFLLIMDENYIKEQDFFTNYNRITKLKLEKLYSYDAAAIHMQVLYRGSMDMDKSPVILRIEDYIKRAVARGEVKVTNTKETAFLFSASFWGFLEMIAAKGTYDVEEAKKLLELQNKILYNGIKAQKDEESIWELLKEKGVNVDKALERMKGNKEAYKSFLVEFFEDPDFESLKNEIMAENARNAFEYAHGLKGMAANLGLDNIHNKLSVLVEILRQGSLENAQESYEKVMQACEAVTELL